MLEVRASKTAKPPRTYNKLINVCHACETEIVLLLLQETTYDTQIDFFLKVH